MSILILFNLVNVVPAAAVIQVDIASVSIIYPNALASFTYMKPVYDLAVENLNRKYNESLNLTMNYIYDPSIPDCLSLLDNVENMMARWYYQRRRETVTSIIIQPSCGEGYLINRFARSWNMLYVSSVLGDMVIRNRTVSPTWITTSFQSPSASVALAQTIFERYNWSTVFVVGDLGGRPGLPFLAKLMHQYLTAKTYLRLINSRTLTSYKPLLREFQEQSRVMIFLSHAPMLRKLMIEASQLNMTHGDYVYICLKASLRLPDYGNYTWWNNDEFDIVAREAYRSILMMQPAEVDDTQFKVVEDLYGNEMARRSRKAYNLTYNVNENFEILRPSYAAIETATQVLLGANISNLNNGELLAKEFLNRKFITDVGVFYINSYGEAWNGFSLAYFNRNGKISIFCSQIQFSPEIQCLEKLDSWPADHWPPPSEPICGYTGLNNICREKDNTVAYVVGISCAIIGATAVTTLMILYRLKRLEEQKYSLWWAINSTDLSRFRWTMSKANLAASTSSIASTSKVKGIVNNSVVNTAQFQGGTVYLILNPNMMMTEVVEWELKKVRHLKCENLVRIVGVCLSEDLRALVLEYCPRGDIYDLVQNSETYTFVMDWNLRFSLILDIVKGLHFIHHSWLRFHGKLRSTKCLIDKSFAIRITDYTVRDLRPPPKEEHRTLKLNWVAPEIIQRNGCIKTIPAEEMRRADIYSLGIIMSEVSFLRDPQKPPEDDSQQKILDFLCAGFAQLSAPALLNDELAAASLQLIAQCLLRDPLIRPDIDHLEEHLSASTDFKSTGAAENLLSRIEIYTQELDAIVNERTASLQVERSRTEELLFEILPKSIAQKMITGMIPDPEEFDYVTVLFNCIDEFGDIVAANGPLDVIITLNELYRLIDSEVVNFDAYKVETIMDTYMVVSGLPARNGLRNVVQISYFALRLLEIIKTFRIESMPALVIQLKIGFHTGKCMAGVIGQKMPRYCLFGDTVNTASRMETTSEGGKIQVSAISKEFLDMQTDQSNFVLNARGKVFVKGKGDMETYWLTAAFDSEQIQLIG